MEIKEITNKDVWENFFRDLEEKTFLQSWAWGQVQQRLGNKIWRLGVYDAELAFVSLVIKVQARRGVFLLIQHLTQSAKRSSLSLSSHLAPRLTPRQAQSYNAKRKTFEFLLDELRKIAKAETCSFIRIAPLWEKNEENENLFRDLGFRNSPMHANAYEATWKLNITPPEQELLMNMRKTTRYLVRQAVKNKDIQIVKSDKIEKMELYNKLIKTVAKHQRFVPFKYELVKNEFEVFSKDKQALLFFGKYREEAAAAALVIFWSGVGFYHQAALHPQYHKIPLAYLLQWEAVKEAKKRGCKMYDFWGYVDPKEMPEHPWAGPSFFKMGFGGKACHYLKTQDLPLSPKYWLIYFFEKLRKTKRGL